MQKGEAEISTWRVWIQAGSSDGEAAKTVVKELAAQENSDAEVCC